MALAMFASVPGVHAATRTWDGGAGDAKFSSALNWDGDSTIPVSGVDVIEVGPHLVGFEPVIGFDTGHFLTSSFTFLPSVTASYRVTIDSFSDSLTLTGSGTTLLNSSSHRHRFELITISVGSANQVWNGGSQGLVLSQIDLGTNQTLTITGTGTTSATRNEIAGGITGNSGLTKAGPGVLLLNNAGLPSDYTGPTTLLGGTLQLGRSDQIPDTSKLVLAGGIFDTGGFSDTIGALSLEATVTIDFGLSDNVSLFFSDSHLEDWGLATLNIINFTAGADLLRFGTSASGLTPSQLARISFNGMQATISSSGFVTPVPEPGLAAALIFSLGLVSVRRRSRATR